MPGKINFIRSFFSVIVILVCIPYLYSQNITNIRFEQEGKKVNIYYDITGANSGQKFDIKVYCSENEGRSWGNPLSSVTGAVGKNRTAGYAKKITWDVLADREKLTGDIKFQIKAIMAGGFVGNSGIFSNKRDRKNYKWVQIGTQVWMVENLNYYTSTGSWCYDNKSSNCEKYGRLYNWETAKKACPDGWHLPSDNEWKTLEMNLGMSSRDANNIVWRGTSQGRQLKEGGTSGFDALLGGYRYNLGGYEFKGSHATFWVGTSYNSNDAWARKLYSSDAGIYRIRTSKGDGFSVRCVKD